MRRYQLSDLSPEERAAATPDPTKLVSFGEVTRFEDVVTANGRKSIPVTFEIFYEHEHGGFGQKCWHRYKDNPNVLVAQHDVTKRDVVVIEEPYSDQELAAMRASLPPKEPPIPDPPPRPLFEKPSW